MDEKGHLKKETQVLIMTAQDQSFQKRWVKYCKILHRTADSPKYRTCGKWMKMFPCNIRV